MFKNNSLIDFKNKIELLDEHHQIEIMRILDNNNISLSENKNGTFINLSDVSPLILLKIEEYLNFVNIQNNELDKDENIKNDFMEKYFSEKISETIPKKTKKKISKKVNKDNSSEFNNDTTDTQ